MTAARPRILCVDDEPAILRFLATVLLRNDYEPVCASDGEEALEKIRGRSVDLVLSDVRMPGMDGFELCRRVKADKELMNTPVVLVTGLTAKEDRVKGIEAGAEDFLTKPIDPAEVLARVKMLLTAKALNERRIGELLIEMKFITEAQLQEALAVAKERKIKVGEALCAMGALDRDQCYWALSNQLNMNYIELSPEMLDPELLRQFPFKVLEELACLPLYETPWEIHFALADPTDREGVIRVKGLRPGKIVQLHLALPEKIAGLLDFFKRDVPGKAGLRKVVPVKESRLSLALGAASASAVPKRKESRNDFVSFLLSLNEGDACWVYRTPVECRLFCRREGGLETIQKYREEAEDWVKERLNGGRERLFLEEKPTGRQGVFRLHRLSCLGRDMVKIVRIPAFSRETFLATCPQASDLADGLRALFRGHRRLFVAGRDGAFVKKCCYLSLEAEAGASGFLPPLFIEEEIQTYFPMAAQVPRDQFDRRDFLKSIEGNDFAYLFYESTPAEWMADPCVLWKIPSGTDSLILFYSPFPSVEAMQEGFAARRGPECGAYGAVYLDPSGLKSL